MMKASRYGALSLVMAALTACTDAAKVVAPAASGNPALALADSPLADSLARGIALALAQPPLRARLRDDLRNSTRGDHSLRLDAYLRSEGARPLMVAAAGALGVTTTQFLNFQSALPVLELVMERPLDRVRWTATPDIVVYGTSAFSTQRYEQITEAGFTTLGARVEVPIAAFAPFPYLAIRPVENGFASRFPSIHLDASLGAAATISTPEEERLYAQSSGSRRTSRRIIDRRASARV